MSKQLPLKQVQQSTMIYQANALINSVYRLTTPGKRCLAMAFGVVGNKDVKPNGTARDEFPFIARITVADYAALFDLPLRTASEDVYAGVMELTTAAFTIYSQNDNGKQVRDVYPWLHHTNIVEAKTERGVYTLDLNPDILGFIGLLERNFTTYDLLNVGQLRDNQWRLYEQFAQHKTHGKKGKVNYGLWATNFDFFTGSSFDIGDSIKKKPAEMKRRFLDTALNAVNEQTDLFVEFEDTRKQWLFKIYSGDLANQKREKWRKEKAESALKIKEEKRLARLRKKTEQTED